MKRKYSLDYSIDRDIDRVAAVKEILDSLDTDPSALELEQMGSYILYGKDENGLNAVQRGETTDGNKRYSSFKKTDDKLLSLEEILENPLTDQSELKPAHQKQAYTKKKPTIARPKYDRKGNLIDPGDSDIPGMQELWDCIDHMEHVIAVNEGKVPPDENTTILKDSYRLYQLKHNLIDLRRHQYYLKDAYKPTLHFQAIDHPKAQFYDWSSDSFYWISLPEWQHRVDEALLHTISKNLENYETRLNEKGEIEVKWVVCEHTFDWENPLHVKALINNYDALYDYLKEKLNTYGRTLIFDFERYRAMANLTEVREFILDRKIEKMPYTDIVQDLQLKYGLKYNENHLCTILAKEIPEKIALAAQKHRLLIDTPASQCKKCHTCGRLLPRDPIFYVRNKSRKDGFSSNCKECERLRRIEKGGQSAYDKRSKESPLHQMQG